MKEVLVTEANVGSFSPYQGNRQLKIEAGSVMVVVDDKVPCVRHVQGRSPYFSIVIRKEAVEVYRLRSYEPDRWSINRGHYK